MAYSGEICQECGLPVSLGIGGTYWSAENDLWNYVMGGPDATDDPGGTLCPRCFTTKCNELGIYVYWSPVIYSSDTVRL